MNDTLPPTLAGLSVGAPLSYLFGHAHGLAGYQTVLFLSFLALFAAAGLTAYQEGGQA
jgi:hypothetical protein